MGNHLQNKAGNLKKSENRKKVILEEALHLFILVGVLPTRKGRKPWMTEDGAENGQSLRTYLVRKKHFPFHHLSDLTSSCGGKSKKWWSLSN